MRNGTLAGIEPVDGGTRDAARGGVPSTHAPPRGAGSPSGDSPAAGGSSDASASTDANADAGARAMDAGPAGATAAGPSPDAGNVSVKRSLRPTLVPLPGSSTSVAALNIDDYVVVLGDFVARPNVSQNRDVFDQIVRGPDGNLFATDRVVFIAKAHDGGPATARKRSSIWFSAVPQ